MNLNVIYKDRSILIVEKPAGIPAQADKTGDRDIQSETLEKFGYAGLVHRLDRPVGGLMVFALNKKAESFLSKEIAGNGFCKVYYAVCCGVPERPEGSLRDWLVKNQRQNISIVSSRTDKNAKEAVLDYKTIKVIEDKEFDYLSLLEVRLHTGRHHQIRVQTANAGIPLWGDIKYNKFFKNIRNVSPALYSAKLEFIHPDTKKRVAFEKKPDFEPITMFI